MSAHHRVGAMDTYFDPNLQKQLLSDFGQKSKIKSQEYSKFIADKKALMTIIYRQCNEATKTKLALGRIYNVDHQDGNILEFCPCLELLWDSNS